MPSAAQQREALTTSPPSGEQWVTLTLPQEAAERRRKEVFGAVGLACGFFPFHTGFCQVSALLCEVSLHTFFPSDKHLAWGYFNQAM